MPACISSVMVSLTGLSLAAPFESVLIIAYPSIAELSWGGISISDFGDYQPDWGIVGHVDDIDRLKTEERSRLQTIGLLGSEPWKNPELSNLGQIQAAYRNKPCVDQKDVEWLQDHWAAGKFGGHFQVSYILVTGNNWKGPIGKFTLEIEQPKGKMALTCFPEPLVQNAQGRKSVTVRNFTPTTDLKVSFIEPPSKK